MTISHMLSLTNKYLAFVSSISLLPLIPLINLSYIIVFRVGLACLLFLFSGSPHTYRLAHPPFVFHLIYLPHLLSRVVSCKVRYLAPFSQIFTPPLSVLSLVRPLYQIHFTPMIHNFSYISFAKTCPLPSLIYSQRFLSFHPECHQIIKIVNQSKTEFLLIGLPQQTSLPAAQPILLTHSAKNLGFIFDSTLSFFKEISSR